MTLDAGDRRVLAREPIKLDRPFADYIHEARAERTK